MQTLVREQLKHTTLSNIQIELLTIFQNNVDDDALKDIRKLLKQYFAEKATAEADNAWYNKQLTNEQLDKILTGEER